MCWILCISPLPQIYRTSPICSISISTKILAKSQNWRVWVEEYRLSSSSRLLLMIHRSCQTHINYCSKCYITSQIHLCSSWDTRSRCIRQWSTVLLCFISRFLKRVRIWARDSQSQVSSSQWRGWESSENNKAAFGEIQWSILGHVSLSSNSFGEWLQSIPIANGKKIANNSTYHR